MSTQKVAVITGASQGIGAALVVAYHKLGYAVVANSRSITPSGRITRPRTARTSSRKSPTRHTKMPEFQR